MDEPITQPGGEPADPAAQTSAPAPGAGRRLLVRVESVAGPLGLAVGVVVLGAVAGVGGWTITAHKAAADAARAGQVAGVARLVAQGTEPLLARDELAAVRALVADAGRSNKLNQCRIVLPDGQVVADAADPKAGLVRLPAAWDAGRLPPEAAPAHAGAAVARVPLDVPGRGKAELQVEAVSPPSPWPYWEAITSAGAAGMAALLSLLAVSWRMRPRLRAVGAMRDALLNGAVAPAPGCGLLLSPLLGPEAVAWNGLVGEVERARKRAATDVAREVLGRRRKGKGDLDAACDAMSHGLMLVDDRGRVKYANGAAAAFLRIDRDALVGGEAEQYLREPKVQEAVRDVAAGTLRRRVVIDAEQGDEDGAGPATGGVLRFSVRPVRREDSASAMIVIEDITQQKAAEEARHAFVAQATHELRTPLTNIRLYVETAIDEGEKDAATRAKCLNVINGETRRLERIVGEMLSVAEIEAGSFKVRADDIRLEPLFDELKAEFAESARDKKLALTFVLPPKLPVIQGDRDKFVLAVHNLVGNALKYTPEGGSVAVQVDADDKHLSVAVKDTGIGIGPADVERIFERFYRAQDDRVAKVTGTGLGLTLAREVARLHGGDIAVESVPDQGSTFTLTVPVVGAKAA